MRPVPDSLYALPTPRHLATYLKSLRQSRGLTQARLGDMIGVSAARISQIEADPSGVGLKHLLTLLHLLGARLLLDVKPPQAATRSRAPSASTGEW